MSIKTITTDDLRRMNGKEGLILQGCGGDPQEWLDGINGLLTDEGILKNGSKFENISVFQNGSLQYLIRRGQGIRPCPLSFAERHDRRSGTRKSTGRSLHQNRACGCA